LDPRSAGAIGRASLNGTGADQNLIPVDPGTCGVAVDALSPPPPPAAPPSNDLTVGKAKKNEHKGTAKLTVEVPGPGELDLAKTKKVKADEESAAAAGTAKLLVKAKGTAKKKLKHKGKAKVTARVTFTPDGGTPNTESTNIKLVNG
jgi:hypothetical protein